MKVIGGPGQRVVPAVQPERPAAERLGPQVAGQDHDRVGEVGHPPGGVGQPAVAQHLQQQIERGRVALLELVQQHDRERLLADLGRQQPLGPAPPAADQPLHGRRRGELAHVEPGQPAAVAEEVPGQRLGHLGLAHAGRADEQQRRDRPPRAGQLRLHRRQQVDHQIDGTVLADQLPGEPVPRRRQVQRHVGVEQGGRQPRLAREGGDHVARRDRPVGRAVPQQVAQEPHRPARRGRVGGVPAVQPVQRLQRPVGQRRPRPAGLVGHGPQDPPDGRRVRLVHPHLLEQLQQVRVLPLDHAQLLRRALGDHQHLAPAQWRLEKAGDPLRAAHPAHLHQLDQVAHVQDRGVAGRLPAQPLAPLLPHAEPARAGDQPRPARAPDRAVGRPAVTDPLLHGGRLARPRRSHQQHAPRHPAGQQVGHLGHDGIDLERRRHVVGRQHDADRRDDRLARRLGLVRLGPGDLLGRPVAEAHRRRPHRQLGVPLRQRQREQRLGRLRPPQRRQHVLADQPGQLVLGPGDHLDAQGRHHRQVRPLVVPPAGDVERQRDRPDPVRPPPRRFQRHLHPVDGRPARQRPPVQLVRRRPPQELSGQPPRRRPHPWPPAAAAADLREPQRFGHPHAAAVQRPGHQREVPLERRHGRGRLPTGRPPVQCIAASTP